MPHRKKILFLLFILINLPLPAATAPKAVRGVIDLRNTDLAAETVELKGEWQFRWQELYVSGSGKKNNPTEPVYAPGPRAWNIPGGHGYATYSLRLLLPEKDIPLSLTMNEQGTAVRVFANGQESGAMGQVGRTAAETIPNSRPLTLNLPEKSQVIDLDLQIANFHYRKGGMWNGVVIGSTDMIRTKVRKALAIDVFVAGCLLIIAAYHVGIFLFYRQGQASILFALFCLAMCLRLVSTVHRVLPGIFPAIPFSVYSRIEFLSWFFIVPLGVHYANAMFRNIKNRWFIPLNYSVAACLTVTLFFSPSLYSYTVVPSQVFMLFSGGFTVLSLIRLLKENPPGIRLFLVGAMVLLLVTINDILYSNEVLRLAQLGPYGMLFFIFCHAMVISGRLFIVFKEKEQAQASLNELLLSRIEKSKSDLLSEKIAAQATRQQFLNVVNNIPGITYRCAPRYPWSIYFVSNEILRLTGYPPEDFVGDRVRTFASIIHPDDIDHITASDNRDHIDRYRLTYRVICADGRIIWVEDSGQAVFDEMQNLIWLDGVMLDITMRKSFEEEILAAREKAEAANIAKSNFLATVSHELRTPLHGVIGMASVLKQTPLTAEQTGYTQIIESSGQALLGLINEILDLAKIESGKIEIHPVEFDLARHIREILEIIEVQARPKNLELSLTIAPELPATITGDPARLRQILLNLLGNAVKFTNAGKVALEIGLFVDADGKRFVSYSVSDTGIGISAASLEMIFKPFQQADQSTTRKFGGTGLGLTISRQLTHMLGGSISVRSVPGEGSVFTVTLPFAEGGSGEKISKADVPLSEPVTFRGQRIILAEDDPVNQLVSQAVLSQMGLQVQIAENGAELLRLMETDEPDLILMDCMMPVMDGYEATRRIRERENKENLPRIPIIALTANALQSDREKCLAAGMDDYISKPFNANDMNKTLQSWLPALP